MKLDFGPDAGNFCQNINDIEVPYELTLNIQTGFPVWDSLMRGLPEPSLSEGGMTPTTVVLFTGDPGIGKSTLIRQLANAITESGHIALYNSTEESIYQIALSSKRLCLDHGFLLGDAQSAPDIVRNSLEIKSKNSDKQFFLFVDSLQSTSCGTYGGGYIGSKTPERVITQLCDFAKQTSSIVVIIGHVTKSGQYAGKSTLMHAIDTHVHMSLDTDEDSLSFGMRLLKVGKNRWGRGNITYPLIMLNDGLLLM